MESGSEIRKVNLPYLINGETEWICTEKHVWLSEEDKQEFKEYSNSEDRYWCPECGGPIHNSTADIRCCPDYYCENCGLELKITHIERMYENLGIDYDGVRIKLKPQKLPETTMPNTPMLDKMAHVQNESQAIGEFLRWLGDQGYVIMEERTYEVECEDISRSDGRSLGIKTRSVTKWLPIRARDETMIAHFYDIDLDQVDKERREIQKGLI
jgi:hypothetical protein